ncbi:MAG: DUF3303 domain-containing protein [Ardenticatenaceae bacterium]
MLFMVIERFRAGAIGSVYERAKEEGRMLPAGLEYVSSWVSEDLTICYQVMCTEDESLFDAWISHWDDLVDFEVVRVLSSAEAASIVLGKNNNE